MEASFPPPPPPPTGTPVGFALARTKEQSVKTASTQSTLTSVSVRPLPPTVAVPHYPSTGHGEGTSSIAWLPGQPNCLVAGMGTRFLRLFDTRDSQPSPTHAAAAPREVANHKAINGLCMDPNSAHQLATYGEGGTVYIWDIRQFSRPVSPPPLTNVHVVIVDVHVHTLYII